MDDLLLVDDDTPPLKDATIYPRPSTLVSDWIVPVPPSSTDCRRWVEVVVREGYVNKETQIANLRQSGRNLADYRDFFYYNGTYDPDTLDDLESEEVVTARHDFDFAEADRLQKHLARKAALRRKTEGVLPPPSPVTSPPLDTGSTSARSPEAPASSPLATT